VPLVVDEILLPVPVFGVELHHPPQHSHPPLDRPVSDGQEPVGPKLGRQLMLDVVLLPEVVGDAALTAEPDDVDALVSAVLDVLGDAPAWK
jgi:hypothetical protein